MTDPNRPEARKAPTLGPRAARIASPNDPLPSVERPREPIRRPPSPGDSLTSSTDLDTAVRVAANPASHRRRQAEPRWRPVLRFAIAIVAAAVTTRVVWLGVPNRLSVSTRIVGYQTLTDFDIFRYTYGFYAFAFLFPLLAIAYYAAIALARASPADRSADTVRYCRSW